MYRSLSIYTFLGLALLFMSSCNVRDAILFPICSGDCAEVMGLILTGDGTEPVGDVLIKVRRYDYIYGSIIKDDIVAKTRTNSSGFYKVSFDANQDGHYEVIIENNDDYYSLHDKEFHEFYLPEITNDSSIIRNYVMPYRAKMTITFEEFDTVENYHWLNISFPLGVDFNQGNGYALSWSQSRSEYYHEVEVAAEVPISLERIVVLNDSTYIRQFDTIYLKRNEWYQYELDFE